MPLTKMISPSAFAAVYFVSKVSGLDSNQLHSPLVGVHYPVMLPQTVLTALLSFKCRPSRLFVQLSCYHQVLLTRLPATIRHLIEVTLADAIPLYPSTQDDKSALP
jgi:hypothetical protein